MSIEAWFYWHTPRLANSSAVCISSAWDYAAMPDAAGEKRKKRREFYRKKHKNTAPLPKLNMEAVPDYGEVAARLMAKMGFKEGMGLGKACDGILEPVAVDAGHKKSGVGYVKPKRKRRRRRRAQKDCQVHDD